MSRKPMSRTALLLLGIFFLVVSIAFWVLAWNEFQLRCHAETTTATLVDWRETKGRNPSFQVRYLFHAEGDNTLYAASDPFWGRDSFCAVTREGFEEARRSRKLQVLYDTHDPWNNRPVRTAALLGDLWFWLAGGSIMVFFGVLCFALRFMRSGTQGVEISLTINTSHEPNDEFRS